MNTKLWILICEKQTSSFRLWLAERLYLLLTTEITATDIGVLCRWKSSNSWVWHWQGSAYSLGNNMCIPIRLLGTIICTWGEKDPTATRTTEKDGIKHRATPCGRCGAWWWINDRRRTMSKDPARWKWTLAKVHWQCLLYMSLWVRAERDIKEHAPV